MVMVVGPNAGGKSTFINLLRALGQAQTWPGLARENYAGLDFSGFEAESRDFSLTTRFVRSTK
jgi:energy-coupling factor transporter ATP-binding protein EcfA2